MRYFSETDSVRKIKDACCDLDGLDFLPFYKKEKEEEGQKVFDWVETLQKLLIE